MTTSISLSAVNSLPDKMFNQESFFWSNEKAIATVGHPCQPLGFAFSVSFLGWGSSHLHHPPPRTSKKGMSRLAHDGGINIINKPLDCLKIFEDVKGCEHVVNMLWTYYDPQPPAETIRVFRLSLDLQPPTIHGGSVPHDCSVPSCIGLHAWWSKAIDAWFFGA